MSVKPILLLGDPRLRLKGLPVDSFGKYLHELLDDLTDSMRHAPGVGLAAPQIGEAKQACVVEVENRLHELVNPRIVRADGDDRDLEGCLSLPGYVAYVTRREKVWVVAQDRHGKKIKVAGTGLLGRALQHELDHLDGKLYIDYLESMDDLIPVGAGDDDEDGDGERTRPSARPSTPWPDPWAVGPSAVSAADAPARTVFFGSGAFGVPILEALVAAPEVDLVGVVSVPDRPSGRGGAPSPTPVAARARRLGLDAAPAGPDPRPDAIDEIADLRAGLGVLADYGRIVPPAILDLPATGSSTSTRRCCRGTAARRPSRRRSWPAIRDGRDAHPDGRGLDTGPDRCRRAPGRWPAEPRRSSRRARRRGGRASRAVAGPWLAAARPQPAGRGGRP